jgi:hypothetical protein
MTRKEWRQKVAEMRPIWDENSRQFREMVARREQRQREWDEYVARRRARLRRLTFGMLGR